MSSGPSSLRRLTARENRRPNPAALPQARRRPRRGHWRRTISDRHRTPARYTLPELAQEYRVAFGPRYDTAAKERAVHASLIVRRFLATAAPVSLDELRNRYALPPRWLGRLLADTEARGDLVQGRFPPGDEVRWCARRLFQRARRRALARARRAVEPGPSTFVAFLQRWQHLDPRDHLEESVGAETVVRQLEGALVPADALEREILAARLAQYDPAWLTRMASGGDVLWAGVGRVQKESGTRTLAGVRLLQRGAEHVWLAAPVEVELA